MGKQEELEGKGRTDKGKIERNDEGGTRGKPDGP